MAIHQNLKLVDMVDKDVQIYFQNKILEIQYISK